jgi:hypothetical protein
MITRIGPGMKPIGDAVGSISRDVFGEGFNRFMPRGMVPPAGGKPQPGQPTDPYTRQRFPQGDPRRYGNPRQFNPGQPGLQPGMPQPMPGMPQPMPSPPVRGKGGGGGKGGFPGPGRPGFGPAPRPPTQPIFDPGFDDIGGDGYGSGGDGYGPGG